MAKVGNRIRIVEMKDEPLYKGREGVITKINPPYKCARLPEQWYRTWGGVAVQPDNDKIEFL